MKKLFVMLTVCASAAMFLSSCGGGFDTAAHDASSKEWAKADSNHQAMGATMSAMMAEHNAMVAEHSSMIDDTTMNHGAGCEMHVKAITEAREKMASHAGMIKAQMDKCGKHAEGSNEDSKKDHEDFLTEWSTIDNEMASMNGTLMAIISEHKKWAADHAATAPVE